MAESKQLQKWRREFEDLRESIMQDKEELEARFEETAMLEAEIKDETDDIRECVADIKRDKQRCREIYRQIPDPKEFSAKELRERSGKVVVLYDLVEEIILMTRYLPRKVDKLAFMLKHRIQ